MKYVFVYTLCAFSDKVVPGAENNGDQDLKLYYWIDPVDATDRLVARPEFRDKMYLSYERQESEQRPTKRACCRANSGSVCQEAQAWDLNSVPMLHLVYPLADKSFPGAHGTKYPVYWALYALLT